MMHHRAIKRELFNNFARIGKALSSSNRLEILDLLSQCERSVETVAEAAELKVANASAHLRVLHDAGLVERRKEGQRVLYRLASPSVFRFLRDLQALAQDQVADVGRLVQLYYESPNELEPVTCAELEQRLESDDVLVLDVRPAEEYRASHLAGAVNVPPDELEDRLRELPKNREIVAYCRGPYCLFSVDAVNALQREGYRARRLAGGLPDWRADGRPVISEALERAADYSYAFASRR
jgi:rhodanese-related sulfurtransferase/DNA-binding transcriptional ArsR family regulator